MKLKDVFKLFQSANDDTLTIDYIVTWIPLYDYHHKVSYRPEIRFASDCEPEVVLSEKVLNAKVIEMSAEDQDLLLIRIEEIV